jgi:hypothetical protein
VETRSRFHTNLFRRFFRRLRAFRIGKIAKDFALLDRLQNFAEFPHGLGRKANLKPRHCPPDAGLPPHARFTIAAPLKSAPGGFENTTPNRKGARVFPWHSSPTSSHA